eukprot:TRINITY_DN5669_c1_g1_i1.p1 TRINITY_DN5669_c1_g1~~TRINITY_DN5669_c1_g1_i1.p1  ORF type:complete len:364 (+),score=-0.09 TRINITY_DN5669_c1_g1_i1:66-1157(+)
MATEEQGSLILDGLGNMPPPNSCTMGGVGGSYCDKGASPALRTASGPERLKGDLTAPFPTCPKGDLAGPTRDATRSRCPAAPRDKKVTDVGPCETGPAGTDASPSLSLSLLTISSAGSPPPPANLADFRPPSRPRTLCDTYRPTRVFEASFIPRAHPLFEGVCPTEVHSISMHAFPHAGRAEGSPAAQSPHLSSIDSRPRVQRDETPAVVSVQHQGDLDESLSDDDGEMQVSATTDSEDGTEAWCLASVSHDEDASVSKLSSASDDDASDNGDVPHVVQPYYSTCVMPCPAPLPPQARVGSNPRRVRQAPESAAPKAPSSSKYVPNAKKRCCGRESPSRLVLCYAPRDLARWISSEERVHNAQ